MLPNKDVLIIYGQDEDKQPCIEGGILLVFKDLYIPTLKGSEEEIKVKMIKEKIQIKFN